MVNENDLLYIAALAAACALAVVVVAALAAHRRRPADTVHAILEVCLLFYIVGLLFLTMRPSPVHKTQTVFLIPFATISAQIRHAANGTLDFGTMLYNVLGNAMLLLPMGFLLPALWPHFRPFWRTLVACLLISAGIEAAQFILTKVWILNRTTDIDDVILNTCGAAVGYGLNAIRRLVQGKLSERKAA